MRERRKESKARSRKLLSSVVGPIPVVCTFLGVSADDANHYDGINAKTGAPFSICMKKTRFPASSTAQIETNSPPTAYGIEGQAELEDARRYTSASLRDCPEDC